MKPRIGRPIERLVDADPRFYSSQSRDARLGFAFRCPIHSNEGMDLCYIGVQFANPSDGGPPYAPEAPAWRWNGQDFETLTVEPSIRVMGGEGGCEWHGFIRDGRFEHCGDAR